MGTLILIAALLAEIYTWYILIRVTGRFGLPVKIPVYLVNTILTLILVTLSFKAVVSGGDIDSEAEAFRKIQFGAATGLVILLASLLLLVSVVTRLVSLIRGRRVSYPAGITLIISFLIVALFADSYFRQRTEVHVLRKVITCNNHHPFPDGMRIALISDLHLSSWHGSYKRLEKAMDIIRQENPDLLINTGDFITYGWKEFGESDTVLAKACLPGSSFAVAGNHDDGSYLSDRGSDYAAECDSSLRVLISRSGYQLLDDTTVVTVVKGIPVSVSGVVTHGHHFNMSYGDIPKTLGEVPDSLFSILLLHDPAGWDLIDSGELPDLTLSGHTHGMQVGFPVPGGYISPASLFHKYWRGLYNRSDKYLYVTTGMGSMGMALRIFMPPEIVFITVRKE